uniref:Secreted protein n=1 Tax=Panagrolaimus sp. ES5 TaxID=591445 RepID=A0AC34FSJ5_9BILA
MDAINCHLFTAFCARAGCLVSLFYLLCWTLLFLCGSSYFNASLDAVIFGGSAFYLRQLGRCDFLVVQQFIYASLDAVIFSNNG